MHLTRAHRCHVEVLSRNSAIAESAAGGLRLWDEALGGETVERVTVVQEATREYEFVFLCTQPPHVEAAARGVVDQVGEAQFVVLQNGLCEARVADIVGAENVIGAIVSFGASSSAPGELTRTSRGGFVLGRLSPRDDDRALSTLRDLVAPIGAVHVSDNLRGARWSKLAINAAISTLGTIGGDTLGRLMRRRVVRRLALEIMTEVTQVAQAEGVALEKVAGTLDLPWLSLRDQDRRGSLGMLAKHAVLLIVGAKYRNLRSSMLRAIENGKTPAVDFLNGEIVTRGEAHGIATPYNRAATRRVHAIAEGRARSGPDSIDALFAEASALAG